MHNDAFLCGNKGVNDKMSLNIVAQQDVGLLVGRFNSKEKHSQLFSGNSNDISAN